MKIARIVLLIANYGYLLLLGVYVVGLLRAGMELSLLRAIPFVMFGFLLAGNAACSGERYLRVAIANVTGK